MTQMKLTPADKFIYEAFGKIGTPERDEIEKQLKDEINAYRIGEAIKKARIENNLTQEELGRQIGVKKSQISKLENGKSVITLPTISKVFRALGFPSGTLDLGLNLKLSLW